MTTKPALRIVTEWQTLPERRQWATPGCRPYDHPVTTCACPYGVPLRQVVRGVRR